MTIPVTIHASDQFLLALCESIYRAEKSASDEQKREAFGGSFPIELLLIRRDKVRVEIRKENVSHNEPHLHITHSDKIDVSLSLNDFRVLAGEIDRRTMKHMLIVLNPVKSKLMEIWNELNEKDNSVGAEKLISNLFE
ncbi:MAG: hypothetical protein RL095_308 [Verrucomicrobiota bacterium]